MEPNNPPENPSPAKSIPVYAKLGLMLVLVFLASIGIFRAQFEGQQNFPHVTEDEEIVFDEDIEEETASFEEIQQRKPIKDLVLHKQDGSTQKLSEFKDKVLIVSFWASWCVPCLEELPTFAKLARQFSKEGFEIIPINVEEGSVDPQFVSTFWQKHNIPFPTYYDPKQVSAQAMDVQIMPTNYVVDRHGRIAFASYGANNWASQKAVRFIRALLKEK